LKYPDARDAFREELRIAYYNSSEKIPFDIFKFYSNIRANFTQYFIQHEQKSMLREIFQSPFLEQLRETPEGKKLEKDLKAYYARYRDRL